MLLPLSKRAHLLRLVLFELESRRSKCPLGLASKRAFRRLNRLWVLALGVECKRHRRVRNTSSWLHSHSLQEQKSFGKQIAGYYRAGLKRTG